VRDGTGGVRSIVEQKDASEVERAIREVNTGVMALPASLLHEMMPRIGCNNAQGEYYLTDLVALCVEHGKRIATAQPSSPQEVEGVNNRVQLAQLERWYQRRLAERLAMEGVTIADPDRIDIRGELRCGADSFIDVNCVFEGSVSIGQNVTIGPNNVLRNVRVGDGTVIEANCVLEDSIIGAGCNVGPFARTRPGTQLATGAKLGNFVETKNAQIGDGAKVNHLSYVGDAVVGAGTNIGAGTITCNYDGANKYKTEIGPDVFVGSNTALVAPVVVAKGATIAAGSVITGDVGENQLAVARGKQRNIDGWKRPQKKPKT
jgi:bifunctional UDP-N-acetylglucosamine pyrophosphorylase/glucosamine-1-phosphate N-acetyltransferase